ncbi:RCC1-like G exchanging factor-like protein [Folsomia candida]|uniref:Williams-Beuren syndrome chromosomal region 16 protein n=1 Tax=Folsomia candida TaxID=158441 RepID=A0A226DQX9_FOLCA|nr:RCC1-like G exchanging factor-like protein [Folsomia candida]OXA47091.1 Williams-Beuren syndrome chromosomal region 16 protein [Folsomia candida]
MGRHIPFLLLIRFPSYSSSWSIHRNLSPLSSYNVCWKCGTQNQNFASLSSSQPRRSRPPPMSKKDRRLNREAETPVYEYNKINVTKNRLYVFGTAYHGEIGLETLIRPKDPDTKTHLFMWKPVRHKFAEFHDLTDIVAGHGFSLFSIKPKGENSPFVFGCGRNGSSQLGYQAARKDGPLETLLSIVPLPISGGKNSRVLAIGAGRAHSLVSVRGEGLFSLGDNSSGQCGRRVITDEAYFGSKYVHKFNRFKEDEVVAISSRFDVSICVTQSGRVFTCGTNNKGQLGRGKDNKFWDFQQVGGDLQGECVKKVVTSGSSVIALTENGQLFSWGCNEVGQANPNEPGKILYHPQYVKLPPGIDKVIDIAMGDYFAFLLNQQGNVYVWGYGSSLGLGPTTTRVKTPTQLPPPLFGCNQFSPDVQVVNIAASFMYNAAINSLGDLYTWGQDQNGCLGLGKMKHQYFPLRVGLGGAARKISLGIDHSLVIARGGA